MTGSMDWILDEWGLNEEAQMSKGVHIHDSGQTWSEDTLGLFRWGHQFLLVWEVITVLKSHIYVDEKCYVKHKIGGDSHVAMSLRN